MLPACSTSREGAVFSPPSCSAQSLLGQAEQLEEVAEHSLKSRADSPVNPPP